MKSERKNRYKRIFFLLFSIFLMIFAAFWSWKIGDPHWIIDEMLLPAFLGVLFLTGILMKGEISDREFNMFVLLGFGVLFFALGGKEGVCVKTGYLSEEHGKYLGLLALVFILITLLYVFIIWRRKKRR